MANWAGGVLTAAGRELQAKVEGGVTLNLTKIKLGDGTESMSAVDGMVDLVSPKAVLGISSATASGDTCTVTGVLSATQLSSGFYCREWGLFAEDPDVGEILFMITIDSQPEWLPASTEASEVAATYALNIAVANAENIEVNIDPAGLVDVDMLNTWLGGADREKAYTLGTIVSMNGLPALYYLKCTASGTTAATTPVIPAGVQIGDTITDGTVTWEVIAAATVEDLASTNLALAESTGYGIVSGCAPTISGLTVTVGAGIVHLADGTRKEISASTVTLDAADSTNPRIDLVYIDSTGTVAKVTGTAAASPSAPSVPSGGISVATVSVAANASTGTLTDTRGMLPRWYNSGVVNVRDFGAVGDGVTDDTAAIQAAIDYAAGKGFLSVLFDGGIYLISSTIVLSSNITVIGKGYIKTNGNVTDMVSAIGCTDISWNNVGIDMNQNENTQDTDVKPKGIYIKDCRRVSLNKVHYKNCKIGRPFYIDGTSTSGTVTDSMGSKYVFVNDNVIDGIQYDTVDEGCYPVIRSDFYIGDGTTYMTASNGVKTSDLSLDDTVSYKRTTEHIIVNNLIARNCDRVALLNVKNCCINNGMLINFYTRGYNISPTCENISVIGGYVSGGDACPLGAGYHSKNILYEGIQVKALRTITGQQCTCKAEIGADKVTFRSIWGTSPGQRELYVLASDNITFDDIKLIPEDTTSKCFECHVVPPTLNNTPYTIKNINILNSNLTAQNGLYIKNQDKAIKEGAIRFINTKITATDYGFWADKTLNVAELYFDGCDISSHSGSEAAIKIPSQNCVCFKNTYGVYIDNISQITIDDTGVEQTFTTYYHANTFKENGTVLGSPDATVYKNGIALIYQVDWFIKPEFLDSGMGNTIRLTYHPTIGDVYTLVRNS